MQENKNTNFFGLIVEEDISSVFLHGYEVTLDGTVVVPQLSLEASAALLDVSSHSQSLITALSTGT